MSPTPALIKTCRTETFDPIRHPFPLLFPFPFSLFPFSHPIDPFIHIPAAAAELPSDALIGGKARSLARLVAAGYPVPPFIVVTTAALRAVIGEAGVDHDDIDALPIPPDLLD